MASRLYNIARIVSERLEVPIGIIQAQLAHESAWGESDVATEYNNFAGIMDPNTGDYRYYDSDEAFVDDYVATLEGFGEHGVQDVDTFVYNLKHQDDGSEYFEADEETYRNSLTSTVDALGINGSPTDGDGDGGGEYSSPSSYGGGGGGSDYGASPYNDGVSLTELETNYIVSNHPEDTERTNISNMKFQTLHGVNLIGRWAAARGLSATLTGGAEGTEYGHADGTYSHPAGWKADIDIPGANGDDTKGGQALIAFAHEQGWSINWEDDHWDIDFSGHDDRDHQAGDSMAGRDGSYFKSAPYMGDLAGEYVAAGLQGAMNSYWAYLFPEQDVRATPYEKPSLWKMMGMNFWDEFSSNGIMSAARWLWGNAVGSDWTFDHNKPYIISNEEFEYLKKALPGDRESQRWIMYMARDPKHLHYLVAQKQEENKRTAELEKWRQVNNWNLQDAMVRFAGGIGQIADPLNFIPIGEAVAGAKMINGLKGSIKDISKAKTIAKYAARAGYNVMVNNLADDALRDAFSTQKPNYAVDAAMSFAGGSIIGALGGFANWNRLSESNRKLLKQADKMEDTGMIHAAGVPAPDELNLVKNTSEFTEDELKKIHSETFEEALKYHDMAFSAAASKRSKIFNTLERNKKVVAISRENAQKVWKKLTNKDFPKNVDALYVPNEDYTMLITDSQKAKTALDKLLAHEVMHGSLEKALGIKGYTHFMAAMGKELKDPNSLYHKAAQKAGSMDPEEVLGQMIEDGTIPKGKGNILHYIQKQMNKRLAAKGFGKNTLSQKDVAEIIQRGAEQGRGATEKIHLNPDGSTVFAGIKFSKDNILNPQNIMAAYDYENDIAKSIAYPDAPKPVSRVLSHLENFGPFGTFYTKARDSVSKTMRTLADMVLNDASGRGRNIRNAMNMEEHKRLIADRLSAPILDYFDIRSESLGKLKTIFSNKARREFDEMVARYYNAVYAGNKSGVNTSMVPEAVKKAAEAIKRFRELELEIGKESSKAIGSTHDNLIDPLWKPVDGYDELWRNVDPDKLTNFLNSFTGTQEKSAKEVCYEFLSEYIDRYAKRDVIKKRIVRDNQMVIAKTAEDKLTEKFLKAHPVNEKDITDAAVQEWLDKHKRGAIKQWMEGYIDTSLVTDEKVTPEVGRLSPLQSRIPLDTSGSMKRKVGNQYVDFSFDNDLRDFDLERTILGNANRFAGEASMKAAFGTTHNFDRIWKKACRELDSAAANHEISPADAESLKQNMMHAIYEVRGLKDPKVTYGKNASAWSSILRGLAYNANGWNMGINQLAETAGTMAYGGAGQFFHTFAPLGKLIDSIRYGDEFARNIAEDLEPMIMGKTMERDIWGRSYVNREIAKNFSRKGNIYDFAVRNIANATNLFGRFTSSVNMLQKLTDDMVRGMRTQYMIDSIRKANGMWTNFMTLRNPFSKAKLRAAGITTAEWESIMSNIKKYTVLTESGRLKNLDYRAWKAADPVGFAKWQNWVQQGADRAIVEARSVGNKSIMKNKGPWMQLLFQFKDYSLRATQGQLARMLNAHDMDDALSAALGIATNVATYAARAGLVVGGYKALGMDKKAEEYKEKMLSTEQLLRAGATRAAWESPLSIGNDFYEALFNTYSIRSTVSQMDTTDARGAKSPSLVTNPETLAGRFVNQIPAVQTVVTPLWAAYHLVSDKRPQERYAKQMLRSLPMGKFLPFMLLGDKMVEEGNFAKPTRKKRNRR